MKINQYHFIFRNYARILVIFLLCFCLNLTGCDSIYRLLQKEGAEERDLFGEVLPFESNQRVEYLQRLLKLYGYNPGSIDGKFGMNTRVAIEKFQKDNNLVAHRFVDRATWKQLNIFISSQLVVNAELNMKKVQMALQTAGFYTGKIDGRMGKKTETALREFQKNKGLNPDGKMGYKTLTQLAQYLPAK